MAFSPDSGSSGNENHTRSCPPVASRQVPADPSDFSTSFEAAAAESSTAMVAVVEEVLEKTGLWLQCSL